MIVQYVPHVPRIHMYKIGVALKMQKAKRKMRQIHTHTRSCFSFFSLYFTARFHEPVEIFTPRATIQKLNLMDVKRDTVYT